MAIPAPFKERLARIYSLLDDADADLLLIDYSELIAWASGFVWFPEKESRGWSSGAWMLHKLKTDLG